MISTELKATLDPDSSRRVKSALDQFPIAVQDRVVNIAFRRFFKAEKRMIAPLNKLPARDLRAKTKVYGKGLAWGAIGYRTSRPKSTTAKTSGRALRASYDASGTGWRSHFEELGTHAWSSSLRIPPSARQRGRGWKRGLYHRGRGTYLRGTNASVIAHRAMAPQLIRYLTDAINELVYTQTLAARKPVTMRVEDFG